MVHRRCLAAKAELGLYLTARGREPGFALMFADKIEDLLLTTGQGFHTVQGNTLTVVGSKFNVRSSGFEVRGLTRNLAETPTWNLKPRTWNLEHSVVMSLPDF
jgi:hypothetical protein